MAFHDILTTVHAPVTAQGANIVNSFGVVVATVNGDSFLAAALAELINLGVPAAETKRNEYHARELAKARMMRRPQED